MKLKQLAEELGARGVTKSGRKRALQLRLRALIIRAARGLVRFHRLGRGVCQFHNSV